MTKRTGGTALKVALAGMKWQFTAGAILVGIGIQASPAQVPVDADEFTARAIARTATLDLRAVSAPTTEDFQITSDLLELATRFAPRDREITRQWLEAAWSAGDRTTALEATRRLITIDPTDQVATLRLVAARIGELQTAEERQAAYARFLGPEGSSLAPTIRSRLALDAALLARERGDHDAFARFLSQATSLDATHKEAAALAATYFASISNDPVGKLELLVNLLYADPLDPNVHLAVAYELASQHSFEAARRFHLIAENLFLASLGELSHDLFLGRLYLVWQVEGASALVAALDRRIEEVRLQEIASFRQRGAIATQEDLERVTLSVPFELMRLMAASAAEDAESIADAAHDLAQVVASEMQRIEAENPHEGEVAVAQISYALDLTIARLFCNVSTESAIKDTRRFMQELPEAMRNSPTMQLALGLTEFREGNLDEARRIITPIANLAAFGGMALALIELKAGNTAEGTHLLEQISGAAPLTLPGAWARSQLAKLDPSKVGPREAAPAMERIVRAIPVSVDDMAVNPWSFVSMVVTATNESPAALERAPLRVTLRNLSDMPLGTGPNRPISTRLLFSPRAAVGNEPLIGGSPEVVDLDTRFRLMPRESVEVLVSPELWWFGTLLETAIKHQTTLRWRVLQGFRISPRGVYIPGASAVTAESPKVRRAALPEANLPIETMVERMRSDPEEELIPIIAAVRATIAGPSVGTLQPATAQEALLLARTAAERYATLSPRMRLMMVALLPHARMIPPIQALDDVILQERDPMVARMVLITRPTDSSHPIFEWALSSGDPVLARLATLQMQRLDSGRQCYARIRDLTGEHEGPLPGAGQ